MSRSLFAFAAVVMAAPFTLAGEGALGGVDLNAALAQARQSGRPVLIDFGTEWCGPCKKLDREVFQNPTLQAQLAARFVLVKIDCDQQEAIAAKYAIRSLPTLVVLGPDGQELGRRTGYSSASDVQRWLGQYQPSAASPPRPQPRATPKPVAPRTPTPDPWAACHEELVRALGDQ